MSQIIRFTSWTLQLNLTLTCVFSLMSFSGNVRAERHVTAGSQAPERKRVITNITKPPHPQVCRVTSQCSPEAGGDAVGHQVKLQQAPLPKRHHTARKRALWETSRNSHVNMKQ